MKSNMNKGLYQIVIYFEKISLAEIVLDHGAVKNNDFITQYLSNTDLYFLLQVSKTISNSVRKFMKKREQEQVSSFFPYIC